MHVCRFHHSAVCQCDRRSEIDSTQRRQTDQDTARRTGFHHRLTPQSRLISCCPLDARHAEDRYPAASIRTLRRSRSPVAMRFSILVSALEDIFAGLRGEARRDHAVSEADHSRGNETAGERECPDFFMELRGGGCATVSLTRRERTASADWGKWPPRLDSK